MHELLVIVLALLSLVILSNCCDVVTVEGQPSEIVCPYTANLVQQRLNVNIYRRHFQGTVYSYVLACMWNNADLQCIEDNDFQLVGYDNHTVTVRLSDTGKMDAGVYNCTHDFTESSDIQQCRLYVKDKTTNCTGASVTEGNDVTVTCHLNGNLNDTKDSFLVKHKPTGSAEYDSALSCIYESDIYDWFCVPSSNFTSANWTINGSTVTLTSLKASAQHTGNYYCDTLPYSPAVRVGFCSVVVSPKGTQINCTGSTVTEGDNATVTCHFNGDLNQTHDNFVLKYRQNDTKNDEIALACNWYFNGWYCQPSSTFSASTWAVNGSTVTLRIPNASYQQHRGSYYCNTVPPSSAVRVDDCPVHVSPNVTTTKVTKATPLSSTSPATSTASWEVTKEIYTDQDIGIIVGTVLGAVLVLFALAVIVICLTRYCRRRQTLSTSDLIERDCETQDMLA